MEEDTYYCSKCNSTHKIESKIGSTHLKHNLNKDDIARFMEFSSSAAAYGVITKNTEQLVRDTQVFKLIGDKFGGGSGGLSNFLSAEETKNYVEQMMKGTIHQQHTIMNVLQGHGAGEVDAVRAINGSLRGLIYEAVPNTTSNAQAVDINVINRFTGNIVERIQVKSPYTNTNLSHHINDFLDNTQHDKAITFMGPRELIDKTKELGDQFPNPTRTIGTVESNRESGDRLLQRTLDGHAHNTIQLSDAAAKIGQGMLIGAAVGIGITALTSYMAYRKGAITMEEAFVEIGKSGAKGAITGGALGGLALLFPPGLLGLGVGIVVGSSIRRIIDIAFGDGAYKDIVNSMSAIQVNLDATAQSAQVIANGIAFNAVAQREIKKDLIDLNILIHESDEDVDRLVDFCKESENK